MSTSVFYPPTLEATTQESTTEVRPKSQTCVDEQKVQEMKQKIAQQALDILSDAHKIEGALRISEKILAMEKDLFKKP